MALGESAIADPPNSFFRSCRNPKRRIAPRLTPYAIRLHAILLFQPRWPLRRFQQLLVEIHPLLERYNPRLLRAKSLLGIT